MRPVTAVADASIVKLGQCYDATLHAGLVILRI